MPDRSPTSSRETAPPEDAGWQETLQRFSLATVAAARVFRQTGNPRFLPAIVRGVLERHVGEDLRERLADPGADPRLAEDLAIDSLTLMEIAISLEDAAGLRLEHEELRHLLTVGEIERTLAARSRAPAASLAKS
jgi:3-hydroxyacyl-[acyl-carrier-protein] dehydratase